MSAKAAAYRAGVPTFCLGHGTNLLVSDRGIRGLVIRLGVGFNRNFYRRYESHRGRGRGFRRAG